MTAEKTDRFPSLIKSEKELPADLRSSYLSSIKKYGASRLSLYAPPLTNLPAKDRPGFPGGSLAIFDDCLFVCLEGSEVSPEFLDIAFDDVISLELGNILLYSWLKVAFGKHHYQEIRIPYNTVGESDFRAVLLLIREKLDATPKNDFVPKVLTLDDLPLKFLNTLQEFLVRDEKIIEFAFQPEIRAWHLVVFSEQIAPPFLAVLTDRQILIIVEEASTSRVPVEKYGETYHYCPLSRFEYLQIANGPDEMFEFGLSLANGGARQTLRTLITDEFKPQFTRLTETAIAALSK